MAPPAERGGGAGQVAVGGRDFDSSWCCAYRRGISKEGRHGDGGTLTVRLQKGSALSPGVPGTQTCTILKTVLRFTEKHDIKQYN